MHTNLAIGHEHWPGKGRKLALSCVWRNGEKRSRQKESSIEMWTNIERRRREREDEGGKKEESERYSGFLNRTG